MLELMLCSMLTVLPDYLYRSRVQGKTWGQEITFFTMWYELRWGITLCAMLTISLITVVFYFHPSTSNVTSFFRTVTILSESAGRVDEVYVDINQEVAAGDPIFRLDSSRQEAAAETARRQIEEVDAALLVAQSDLGGATGALEQAQAAYRQIEQDLKRRETLLAEGSSAVTQREVDTLRNQLDEAQGALDAAEANLRSLQTRIEVALPAQRATAQAALAQAETEIGKMTVYAGIDARIEQFDLRVGDIVNPILRPAGVLVPLDSGRNRFQAGFPQVAAQVIRPGSVAEIACVSQPFSIVPMVVVQVQDVIAAGQIRPSDQLLDIGAQGAPGTVTVFMEPLYPGTTDLIPPGSRCLANAYTNNHERLETEDLGFFHRIGLHVVDTVGVVHAAGLRLRALLMPFQLLVFTGH
ncbi:biotin/lipoyl-binding protein [Dinoroseobacter sp. PD6]|nr:biotin/lipoyl-binding protein [Dinoroseobacter sp. PD6]MDD9715172.1 biotin/lipoyl-binding protein [Dinoroseobacter sp. PD6]